MSRIGCPVLGRSILLGLAALVFACGSAIGQQAGPDDFSADVEATGVPRTPLVASGVTAGVYFPVANILAELAGGDFDVVATSGSIENLVRLSMGDVDFAIALSDRVAQAMAGLPPFDHLGVGQDLRVVMALFPEPLTILVRADEDIQDLSGLDGRTVNMGVTNDPTGRLFRLALDASGSLYDDDNNAQISLADQTDALCSGEVDAIAYLAAHPSGTVYQAATTCAVRALAITGEVADALLTADTTLVATRIPGGIYPGIDRPVDSVGPVALLVTRADVAAEQVDLLVGGVLDNLAIIGRRHPVLMALDRFLPIVMQGPWPLHDRAAALLSDTPTL